MKKHDFLYLKNKKKFGLFKDKTELPIELFNEGLFVFGAKDSSKKDFLIDLSYKVIKNNLKLVFLTDSHYTIRKLSKQFNNQNNKSFSSIKLLDLFKNKNIEIKDDFTLLTLDQNSDFPFKKQGKRHFPEVINKLSKLENTVVIIDEVLNQNINENDLFKGIKKLKESNVGLVIGDYYPSFYKETYSLIDNHILYYMYDAPFEFKDHPIIINEKIDITFFEKRELHYRYNLFSFYKHSTQITFHDLRIN